MTRTNDGSFTKHCEHGCELVASNAASIVEEVSGFGDRRYLFDDEVHLLLIYCEFNVDAI